MLGYHVFYHVQNSKKSYNSTEFYLKEFDAKRRALELAVACNVTFISIRTIEIESKSLEIIKGSEDLDNSDSGVIYHPKTIVRGRRNADKSE